MPVDTIALYATCAESVIVANSKVHFSVVNPFTVNPKLSHPTQMHHTALSIS